MNKHEEALNVAVKAIDEEREAHREIFLKNGSKVARQRELLLVAVLHRINGILEGK